MSQKNIVRSSIPPEDVIENPTPTLTGIPKPLVLGIESLPALPQQHLVPMDVEPAVQVDRHSSEYRIVELKKAPSLIPSNRLHHSVKREFDHGNIRIIHVQERGKSQYQVVVCRRKRSKAESESFGDYEVCEIGPIKLVTGVIQDRGFVYLRTEPDEVELPDAWAICIQYQDLEIVRDANCEDHVILVQPMLARYALTEPVSIEAKKRLMEMFSIPYPWSTREPKLVRDGYTRKYLRLNPAMLRGEFPT